MLTNFPVALKMTLAEEGGWVNNPQDPGGETNLGVTKSVWEAFVGHAVPPGSLKSLTIPLVTPLYKSRYWDAISGDSLPDGADAALFDYAVNSGVGAASKALQHIVGVPADGQIGPQTLNAVSAYAGGPAALVSAISSARLGFLKALPAWETFGANWGERVQRIKDEATSLI